MKPVRLLTVGQTAALLARLLGPGRQWVDTLNDHRQDRSSINDRQLLPCARMPGSADKCGRPLYHPSAIVAFVKDVRELFGCKQPFASEVSAYTFAHGELASTGDRYWFTRVVQPVTGTPATA